MKFYLKITLALFLLIVGFVLIFYLNLGKILGYFLKGEDISKFFRETSGLELKIENPEIKTKINLHLLLNFDELQILTPEKKELLGLEKSSLEIKILPLLAKKISIKKFNSVSMLANVLREKDGKFEIEKYFNPENKMDFEIELKNSKISLGTYKIYLQDDFSKSKSELFGNNFDILSSKNLFEFQSKGEVKTFKTGNKAPKISTFALDLKTKLPIKKHLSDRDFKFNVILNNFDISQYSTYIKTINPDLIGIKGVFDVEVKTNKDEIISEILIKDFEIPDKKYEISSKEPIKISSKAFLKDDFIEIETLKLFNKNFNINASGKILDYKNNKPKAELSVKLENTVVKSVLALLPNLIPTPENSIFKLKNYAADGLANGKIQILGELSKPQIKGRVDIIQITLLNKLLKIPPSFGYVEFLGDKIYVNARAMVAPKKYVDVIGIAEFYGKQEGDFHITSAKNLDLKTVEILLLPIRDIIGFKLGPVPYMDISGLGSIDLRTEGNKKKAKLNGYFEFSNAKVYIEGVKSPLSNGVGKVYFKNEKITFDDVFAKLYGADLKIYGIADILGNIEMNFVSKNLDNKDIAYILKDNFGKNAMKKFAFIEKINFKSAFHLGFKTKFDDNFDGIDPKELNFYGTFQGMNSKNSDVVFNSGKIILKNNKIYVDKFAFNIYGADIFADLIMDKFFDNPLFPKPTVNGKIVLNSFPLQKLNETKFNLGNKNLINLIDNFENFSGELSGQLNIVKNEISAKLALGGLYAVQKSKNIPIKVHYGNLEVKNNRLVLDALNFNYGLIPIYFSAKVSDITAKKPFIDARFSTSLAENDVDKIINSNLLYPIKVKGEVALRGMLKGYVDNYNIFATVKLDPQSDISYMGANFGDMDLKREVKLSVNFQKNIAKINNFEYLKYVSSQNNKLSPITMVKAWGEVVLEGASRARLKNLRIETHNATTARIFNIMFRKSILKQGQFNCNLLLNGYYDDLKMLGNIDFIDINIPLYDSKIKDAQLHFSPEIISANLSGKGFESDVKITSEIVNSTKLPVVIKKVDINSTKINIGKIIDELSELSGVQKSGGVVNLKEQIVFNPKDIIIENGEISASEVNLYDINAKNFSGKFTHLPNSPFKFENTVFDIAGGKIASEGTFDFETTKLTLNSKIQNCEANVLSQSFLGISNQLFGVANGEIFLTGSRLHTAKGLQTVGAHAMFSIKEGKMPRLGSLEYLLRAGNIYKSGILGLTLNNIIEVLIPYKTGEFSAIRGNLLVQSGIIEKLEIYSKGDNLSIFVHGKYDLINDAADIEVLGRLSKKVSNLLGPIGNASFNSLLNVLSGQGTGKISQNELVQNINKIPLIEITREDFRIFQVKITGDLNKEGYVKTFNWLN